MYVTKIYRHVHCIMYTLHSVYYTYTAQCIIYIHCTVYTIHTLHSVYYNMPLNMHCMAYIIKGKIDVVQCTFIHLYIYPVNILDFILQTLFDQDRIIINFKLNRIYISLCKLFNLYTLYII